MAAGSQSPGAEPSPADGGRAGFEGISLLGWKWISERHNGSLRRVCCVVLKPGCAARAATLIYAQRCRQQPALSQAFLIAMVSSVLAATALIRHPSKP